MKPFTTAAGQTELPVMGLQSASRPKSGREPQAARGTVERLVDLSSLDDETRCWLQHAPASAIVTLVEAIRDELECQNRAHRSALTQRRGQDLRMVEQLAFRTRTLCLALCAGYRGKDDAVRREPPRALGQFVWSRESLKSVKPRGDGEQR